ncbi:hypothetical protein Lfu02_12900 [Longispora fulva]|uniref:Putative metal-binding membrane protein n=1 Tax=Longispora fulva TaxID=619741 RepID=A0A8J7KE79_9ACTN|nr:DUF2182 domain-containing protein [Longispora fulva]MBG6134850.1 putative metal-binding membrane protein [Longispora fulva]GIG56918.1 hypothetical protein Lfu02_12900 [Longispora fulva]
MVAPRHAGLLFWVAGAWFDIALLHLGLLGGAPVAHHHGRIGVAAALAGWLGMTVTMMVPPLFPLLRHLTASTLRRRRAVWLFLVGYLVPWAGYGLLLTGALAAFPGVRRGALTAAALLVAAGWQVMRVRRRLLRGCRTGTVLPAHGWRADAGAWTFGLRNGSRCVGACWAMMLVMAVATTGHLPLMVLFFAVVWAEKVLLRARVLARPASAAFATLAVAYAVL